MYLHIPFHRIVPRDQDSASCGPFKLNIPASALEQAKMVSPCRSGHPASWALCMSIHLTGSTDSVLGEQCSALRRPGLGTRHSRTHLASLWGRTGLHSCTVTSATAALPRSRVADSTLAPQASRPAAPSSGWPRKAKHQRGILVCLSF